MLYKLFLLFIIVPLVEMGLLFWLAGVAGWYVSLGLVIASALLGAALAQHQGFRTWRRIREEMGQNRMPGDALFDAALILCASLFLLTPGIMTDILGMALLIPNSRQLLKPRLVRWFKSRFAIPPSSNDAPAGRSQVIDSYVVDSQVEKGSKP